MAPGQGEVARVYISSTGDKKPGVFAVDTCFVPPHSTLMLVDQAAKTIIPSLKIINAEEMTEPEKEKKAKKEKKE
jgi:hypothetical protein